MKKPLLISTITILALTGFGAVAMAREYEDRDRGRDRFEHGVRSNRVGYEIAHLNRMFAHVRGELRRYRGGRSLWFEFSRLERERDRLNAEYRGGSNPYRIHTAVERLRWRLRHIEEQLRLRSSGEYFRWELR